jgi:hypothetical protein
MHPAKPAKSSRTSAAAAPPPASQSASRAPARWSDLLVATKRSDRTIAQLRRELKKKQAAWAALTGQAAPAAPAPASASDSVTSLRAALAWYESQDAYVAMVPHLIKHLSLRGGGASPEIAAAVAPFWTAYKTLLANALTKAEELHRALTTLLTPTNPPMSKERKLVYFRKSILYLESLKSMYSTLNGYVAYVKDTTKRMTPAGAADPTEIPAGLLDAHTPIRETLQLLQNNPNTCRLNSVATPLNELMVIVDAHRIGLGAAGAAPIVSGGGACLAKEPMTFEDLQAKTVEIKKQYEATRAALGLAPTRPEQTDEELLAELDGLMVDSERAMGDELGGEFGEMANSIKGGTRRRGRVVKPKSKQ